MDFYNVLKEVEKGYARNPYAARKNGIWIEGLVSIDFLNNHFKKYSMATEMKNATESEGLKLFFDWLVKQGKLPA